MNMYTRQEAKEICERVIGLPMIENSYDVVDLKGSLAMVHHHSKAKSIYTHLRGVLIDLDDKKIIARSSTGSISTILPESLDKFADGITGVYHGVEGTHVTLLRHKDTTYYLTNRRIYRTDDDMSYVKNINALLKDDKTFSVDSFQHEMILVTKDTSLISDYHIPDEGYLVHINTRMVDQDEDKMKDMKKKIDAIPVLSRPLEENTRIFRNVKRNMTVQEIKDYVEKTKEFCIIHFETKSGLVVIRVAHQDYLFRESIIDFSYDKMKRFIRMAKDTPVWKNKNRKNKLSEYIKKYKIYDVPELQEVQEKNYSIISKDPLKHCDKWNTDQFLINTWINLYSCLPERNKKGSIDVLLNYMKCKDKMIQFIESSILNKPTEQQNKVLKSICQRKISVINRFLLSRDKFRTEKRWYDNLRSTVTRNVLEYTSPKEFIKIIHSKPEESPDLEDKTEFPELTSEVKT